MTPSPEVVAVAAHDVARLRALLSRIPGGTGGAVPMGAGDLGGLVDVLARRLDECRQVVEGLSGDRETLRRLEHDLAAVRRVFGLDRELGR